MEKADGADYATTIKKGFIMKKWIELTLTCERDFLPHLSSLLMANKISKWAEEEEDGRVRLKIYFPYLEEILPNIENLKQLLDVEKVQILTAEIDNEDWAVSWQKFFQVERVGKNIVIKPPWENLDPKEGEMIIEIEPRMAFGSGFHPTTKLTLILAEKYLKPGMNVLDMGAGSGILSILALKMGAGKILALDYDEIAVKEARLNLAGTFRNEPDKLEKIQVDVSDGFQAVPDEERFDLVMINVNTRFIVSCLEDVAKYLKTGGIFVTGSIEGTKAEFVNSISPDMGLVEIDQEEMDGWVGVAFKKNSR